MPSSRSSYIESLLGNPAGWITAVPMLQASDQEDAYRNRLGTLQPRAVYPLHAHLPPGGQPSLMSHQRSSHHSQGQQHSLMFYMRNPYHRLAILHRQRRDHGPLSTRIQVHAFLVKPAAYLANIPNIPMRIFPSACTWASGTKGRTEVRKITARQRFRGR